MSKVHNLTNPDSYNHLLIIEDSSEDTAHYLRLLKKIHHPFKKVISVTSLTEGLKSIDENAPACCLLDNFLTDGTAFDFLNNLKSAYINAPCPIIVITGQEDTSTAVKLMHTGAQDYLIKQDMDATQLQRAIYNSIKTWELQSKINQLALYDSLTGLGNRTLFIDNLNRLFNEYQRYNRSFALLFLDLDRFKLVNDTYGHEAGDVLLKQIGQKVRQLIRKTDIAARLGGDEFAILLPDIKETKANYVAFKLVKTLNFDFKWKETTISTSSSVGLAMCTKKIDDCNKMMREADIALYQAKKLGRARYSSFNLSLEKEIIELECLACALPHALQQKQLQVAWQPIVNVTSQQVDCVEALIRWYHNKQWINPLLIIDLMLERRLGDVFHKWLFEYSLEQLSLWKADNSKIRLSLNLPANLCHDSKIIQLLIETIKFYGIPPESVTVEVTETHLMDFPEETRKKLIILSDFGIRIAIDDFGTGYSSMKYLANLPCNILKIDQTFFLTLEENPRNSIIIEAITALAHRMKMQVVAEGIESQELYQTAQSLGCDYVQGYWLGEPDLGSNFFNNSACYNKIHTLKKAG